MVAAPHRLTLAVFIDAYGWRVAERHPLLQGELSERRPLETVFGYSSSCDPTILTGTMPREHGHFTFFRYAPDASPFKSLAPLWRALNWLPASLTNRGRVRRYLSRIIGRRLGVTGYFHLYASRFDRLRADDVPFFCSNWRQQDSDNLRDMNDALATGAQQKFASDHKDRALPITVPKPQDREVDSPH